MKKFTAAQQEVIDKMNDGYLLTYNSYSGVCYLWKDDGGFIPTIKVKVNTFNSLSLRKIIYCRDKFSINQIYELKK